MKAPSFWNQPPGFLASILWPFGWLYGRITAWRMRRIGKRVGIPVICIGNFTAGGAGKTPTALFAAEAVLAAGMNPFFLSRGYGGSLAGPVLVDPAQHTAADCGDEPLLLVRVAPVILAWDRAAGAAEAIARGADILIMDDGMQNPSLAKDTVIAVVDGGTGLGNGFCLPAGPLRAPLADQLPLTDAVLIIGTGAAGDTLAAAVVRAGKPVFRAELAPVAADIAALRGKPLLAFAGIGRPDKFTQTLAQAGLDVRQTRAFPDHHVYRDDDIRSLLQAADRGGLTLVTTQKDAVKIHHDVARVHAVGVTLVPAEGARLALLALLTGRRRLVP
jgi:tetraacyldisaccharide 4'-kinase